MISNRSSLDNACTTSGDCFRPACRHVTTACASWTNVRVSRLLAPGSAFSTCFFTICSSACHSACGCSAFGLKPICLGTVRSCASKANSMMRNRSFSANTHTHNSVDSYSAAQLTAAVLRRCHDASTVAPAIATSCTTGYHSGNGNSSVKPKSAPQLSHRANFQAVASRKLTVFYGMPIQCGLDELHHRQQLPSLCCVQITDLFTQIAELFAVCLPLQSTQTSLRQQDQRICLRLDQAGGLRTIVTHVSYRCSG